MGMTIGQLSLLGEILRGGDVGWRDSCMLVESMAVEISVEKGGKLWEVSKVVGER